jgi:pimeloyl-ACP methyl ester carboxylesterase
MKKLYSYLVISFALLVTNSFAQPCQNGRYATEVFPNHTLTSNITYGANTTFSGANNSLKLDFYEPTGDTELNRPLIIWVHGGSFLGGSKTDPDMTALSQRFARKGYACASIDYRLGFFPIDSANAVKAVVRAVQDLKAAIRFFYKDKQTTDTYHIDTNLIYVGGSSAGAITALHVAYLDDVCEISDYLSPATISQLGGLDGNSGNPGFSTSVKGVINLCGALAKYSWLEAGDVPMVSIHGTADGTVKYNRGIVNPGTALMYLDGSRMLHERACAVNVSSDFYTFPGAGHVPYIGNNAYMDTTEWFIRDFLVTQLGCNETPLQLANTPIQQAILYPTLYCDGTPVDEVCIAGIEEPLADIDVSLYPNPATDYLTLVTHEALFNELFIMDLQGRIILSHKTQDTTIDLDLTGLNPGNYLVNIILSNGKSGTKSVIVR